VSTPGSGGPQPPEQDPSQFGQAWGQQPPAGPPQGGQQPWGGAPQQPGQPGQQWGAPQQPGQPQQWGAPQQPGQPGQPWGAPQGPGGAQAVGQPQKPKRKVLQIVLAVLAAIVVLGALSTFLGAGDPEVGDCLHEKSLTEYETVDCDSDDAQYRVEGTDEDMTYNELEDAVANETACSSVDDWTYALWLGEDEDEDGKVFCTTDV